MKSVGKVRNYWRSFVASAECYIIFSANWSLTLMLIWVYSLWLIPLLSIEEG